ncbi:MAG: hypothetical protein KME25_16210 [Symplocastrum torsivum CPER-KK1]|uniref:Uncharacterized protein n=1 Tax=Symplocastrum torsivum CPER-KK1 TaxID=450513 RepID=A0A951UBS8_9CYAN|nr:hypothetical protein [Symplocastrum torsivum CPER-KK1]
MTYCRSDRLSSIYSSLNLQITQEVKAIAKPSYSFSSLLKITMVKYQWRWRV